jgi:hypothetical protein
MRSMVGGAFLCCSIFGNFRLGFGDYYGGPAHRI